MPTLMWAYSPSSERLPFVLPLLHGGFTPCQVEHHMRTEFATHILHAIEILKIMIFFQHKHNH